MTSNLPKSKKPKDVCCPLINPKEWDGKQFHLDQKPFVVARTVNFLHIPLNIASVFKKTCDKIEAASAGTDDFVLLSDECSPWRGTHYFAVKKDVPGLPLQRISGDFYSRVFEGPYRNAPQWMKEMKQQLEKEGQAFKKIYFYYTACPKCSKEHGKNYVVLLAEL